MNLKAKKPAKLQTKLVSNAMMTFVMQTTPPTKSARKSVSTSVNLMGVVKHVRFGIVSMEVAPPSPASIKTNIFAGQKALTRARDKILTPGVRILSRPDIPLFSADPKHPEYLIRKLAGKKQRGQFVDGKFKVVKASSKAKVAKAAKAA